MMLYALALATFASANPLDESSRVAVIPTVFSGDTGDLPLDLFDDSLLTAVQNGTRAQVIGRDDINAMLGFERTKELVGCDGTSCVAEIGGALGVGWLLAMKVARLTEDWVVTCKLIDIQNARAEARTSDFIAGGSKELLVSMPYVISKLMGGSGGRAGTVPAPVRPEAAPEKAIASLTTALRDKATELWPKGDREAAAPVVDTLVALASYRLKAVGDEPETGAFGAARSRCRTDHDAPGCVEAADRLLTGTGISESVRQGGEYLVEACELDDADACSQARALTAALLSSSSIFKRTSAEQILVKMCLAGLGDSCDQIAKHGGPATNNALANACDQHSNAYACATLVSRNAIWSVGRSTRAYGYGMLGAAALFAGLSGLYLWIGSVDETDVGSLNMGYGVLFGIVAAVLLVGGVGTVAYGIYEVSKAKGAAERARPRDVAVSPALLPTGTRRAAWGVSLQLLW